MCYGQKFNPFYVGPYPERACGDCPYGHYSGYTRCGWTGGNGPFGTTFCDANYDPPCGTCCGSDCEPSYDSSYGSCYSRSCDSCGSSWFSSGCSSCCSSCCSQYCGRRCSRPSRSGADCCVICGGGLGRCGEPRCNWGYPRC
ncbi:hypothetical protein KR038_008853 [Drosophila bunnanda]|nr:hypothetical protein KR038_008853 [Drosophila bunnanda]